MKIQIKNLLPRKVFEGVALISKFSNIKLRVPKKVIWLTISLFIFFTFGGYYPTLTIPPVKRSEALAEVKEQKGEIIFSSFSKPLVLPHPGYLTTRFSNYHPGIDIAAGLGMPIHPVTDGVVTETGHDIFGLGNYVIISHENGFKSKYCHMGDIYVKSGDKVTSDNIIGKVGLTGHTSGPHTHLEITLNGNYVDPQKLLPEIPDLPLPTVASASAQNK